MKACVIDASVAIKWYVPEAHGEEALRLLALRQEGALVFHVPDLFVSEVGNILWKKVRRGALEEAEAQEVAGKLLAVPMVAHGAATVFGPALELSCAAGVTFYDAVYVALAVGVGGELVTADERLGRAAAVAGWRKTVRLIQEF